ncbi:MBL fold metallo-hydrolase [bacterium]|nr:MBL fold metallo-hydrolase [bacterium]
MKITVLVDNNTLIDRYFFAEPGLSLFIEDGDVRLLFDVGYSDIFLINARKMNINLLDLDYVALSHGHLDHTWGLDPLIRYYTEAAIENQVLRRPLIIGHPEIFVSVMKDRFGEFGSLISEEKLSKNFKLSLSCEPQKLSERLIYLGEIPRLNEFESNLTFGRKQGSTEPDTVPEDSALVYQSEKGLVIITGCSHAGICNIIDYAIKVCEDDRIFDIVGGLHLQNPSKKQLQGTVDFLKEYKPLHLHACHCTDLHSKIVLSQVVPVEEVGVGLTLSYV